MGADAAAKSRKTSSVQLAEAADAGKKKPRKQRRGSGASSSSEAGMKQPAGAEASSDTGKEMPGGRGDSGGEMTLTLKSAAEASEGEKGERSKEDMRDSKSTKGESKRRGSRRNDQGDVAETTQSEKAKRGKRSDPEPAGAGKEVAAAAADCGTSNKRVWSEEDVLRLLRGIIECQGEHGVDACSRIDLIHKHIRETQHMEFSRTQLYEKLRRLKHKFESTISRMMKGDNPAFTKPHDGAVFELSKRIWTVEKVTHPLVAVHNDDNGDGANEEEVRAGSPYPNLKEVITQLEKESVHHTGGGLLKKGFEALQPSKAKTLEDRWKANSLAGMKFLLENSKLKNELLEACVEALGSHAP